TSFVERNVLRFLPRSQLLGGFAVGITGTRQELPEAALLENQGPAAVVAVFRFVLLGHALLRDLARIGALRVPRAGDELAVAPPLDHHGLAALLANLVGGLLHALDVGHVALGVFQV